MSKLKQFLEGCVTIADGVDRAANALARHGSSRRSAGPYIDVAPESEVAAYGFQPPQGAPRGPDPRLTAPLPPGQVVATYREVRNIDERVRYIVDMIQKGRHSAEMRKFAVKAISRKCGAQWCTPEGDHWAEVRALFDACKEVYRYCGDAYGIDQFQHPERTLEFGGGDCDDCTILICSALGAVGFQTKARVIRTKSADDWNHIFALCGLPQKAPTKWVPLDLSVNEPAGWQPPRELVAAHRDYDIPLR